MFTYPLFGGRTPHRPTTGVVAGGANNSEVPVSTANKYDFPTATFSTTSPLLGTRNKHAGMGGLNYAIFAGGAPSYGGYLPKSGAQLKSTEKYDYTAGTFTAASDLIASYSVPAWATWNAPRHEIVEAGAGNLTTGILGGGIAYLNELSGLYETYTTEKYNWASEVVTVGGQLSILRFRISAAGNNNVVLFRGGRNGNGSTGDTQYSQSDKYNYSDDTVTAGTALYDQSSAGQSAANENKGFWVGGLGYMYFFGAYWYIMTTLDEYEFSSDTNTYHGGALDIQGRYEGASLSDCETMVIAGGVRSTGGSTGAGYATNSTASCSFFNYVFTIDNALTYVTHRVSGATNGHGGLY